MHEEIDRTMQRTRRYWYEDGLTEIAVGCVFALIGLLFFVEAGNLLGPYSRGVSAIGLPIVMIGSYYVARIAVKAAKARLTYPRTGYVSYCRTRSRWQTVATTGGAAVFAAGLVIFLRNSPATLAWIPALDGLCIGVSLVYMGYTAGIMRFYFLALVSAFLGTASGVAGLVDSAGSALYFGGQGIALILAGGLALWRYVHQPVAPSGE